MPQSLLKFGIHDFLNASPLLFPLKERGHDMGFQIITDSPAVLADRLKLGNLDLAMIPSVEYFKLADRYRLISDACITSRGKVQTVLFLAKKPIREISSIAADIRSRTSVALLRILFSFNSELSIHPYEPNPELMLTDHSAALIIGDSAFKLGNIGSDVTVYDLSEEWFRQTGKTFVHAVLVAQENISLGKAQKNFIKRAKLEGCKRIKEIISGYKNLPKVDVSVLEDYLENKIKYDLDDEAIDGLTHFSNLCYLHGITSKEISIKFL
jgi:chorismate dehydratase